MLIDVMGGLYSNFLYTSPPSSSSPDLAYLLMLAARSSLGIFVPLLFTFTTLCSLGNIPSECTSGEKDYCIDFKVDLSS